MSARTRQRQVDRTWPFPAGRSVLKLKRISVRRATATTTHFCLSRDLFLIRFLYFFFIHMHIYTRRIEIDDCLHVRSVRERDASFSSFEPRDFFEKTWIFMEKVRWFSVTDFGTLHLRNRKANRRRAWSLYKKKIERMEDQKLFREKIGTDFSDKSGFSVIYTLVDNYWWNKS